MTAEEIAWELGDIEDILQALENHTDSDNKSVDQIVEGLKVRKEELWKSVRDKDIESRINAMMLNRYQ